MPIIQINILEGRTLNQKKKLVEKLTHAVVESLGAPRETVRVMINEMSADHYAISGELISERRNNT